MSYGGSSGGSGKIASASDAALNNPATGDALIYDATLQKWTNGAITKLGTVTVSGTPASGKYLDGSGAWTTLPVNTAGDTAPVGPLPDLLAKEWSAS